MVHIKVTSFDDCQSNCLSSLLKCKLHEDGECWAYSLVYPRHLAQCLACYLSRNMSFTISLIFTKSYSLPVDPTLLQVRTKSCSWCCTWHLVLNKFVSPITFGSFIPPELIKKNYMVVNLKSYIRQN